ncbi:MAG: PqqD family protein [Candidatus Omnitrophota bacterium]
MEVTYSKDPDIIFRKIADEFILVPIRQKAVDLKSVYTLNEVAAFIWELLDSVKSAAHIRDKVAEKFEVESIQAQADVLEMLSQLEALKLIKKT